MKLIRVVLGLIVTAYGAVLLVPMLNVSAYKLGAMRHVKAAAVRMIPLWRATPVWEICVWVLAVVLMLAAGVQLIRGRPAFRIFVVALVADAGLWWTYRSLPEYQQAFTPQELRSDYYILAIMLLVGA